MADCNVPGRLDDAKRPRDGVDTPSELVLEPVAGSPSLLASLNLLCVVLVNGHQGHRLPLAIGGLGQIVERPIRVWVDVENRTRMCVGLQVRISKGCTTDLW